MSNQPEKTECGFCDKGIIRGHKWGDANVPLRPCLYCEGTGYAPTKEDQ